MGVGTLKPYVLRWKILNSEEDDDFLQKQKKNPDDYMPDIVFKALREILDGPLNKAGMVRSVYVKVDKGVLFEIRPHVRIPRTLELLQKSRVCSTNGEILLHVLEEPVTCHLPINSCVIGLCYHSKKLVDLVDYVSAASDDLQLVFVVGAMLHGSIRKEYTDDLIADVFRDFIAGRCEEKSEKNVSI
ncbi:putative ribosomal RNA small subunit methyltransferase nep-1 [Cocos nucifera]|uniref:Putative ribosomal RNA small subunit methyltransferase nep-1 n=1 Tax=Cocos nucifera TaxID=13894 RepID=A0A8K0HX01_COCNU|nr:putative ribosomal RNA small subunit methyltransferase nep-1 [Cocos nucifera]